MKMKTSDLQEMKPSEYNNLPAKARFKPTKNTKEEGGGWTVRLPGSRPFPLFATSSITVFSYKEALYASSEFKKYEKAGCSLWHPHVILFLGEVKKQLERIRNGKNSISVV